MYESPLVMITYVFVSVTIVAYVGFAIVVTIGGVFDLLFLFRELKASELDETDDGRGRDG